MPRSRARYHSIAVTFVLLLVVSAYGKDRPMAKSWPGAPVVLVTIDTLRSDHLPMYGYTGVETPVLSAFTKEAILFERAYSHVPLTLPSHGTIFTGTLPAVNGLRDNLGYRLNPKLPTAAELLKKAGYDTGAAISCIVLNAGTGIERGFDDWKDIVESKKASIELNRVERSGAETEALLAAWVEQRPAERPFFAFLHLYEPHSPYSPPEPYASRYRGRDYDGEIAWSDELVGRFFDVLKKKGAWDRTFVIVLSDHGEGLGEHGEDEHGVFLYRYALQVPLMVKLPEGARGGLRVETPVQLSDVFTTILRAVGLDEVPAPAGTVSLLDVADGAKPSRRIYAETLFPRIHLGWSDLASLLDVPWQYIDAPRPELYDLVKDPAENENLAAGKTAPFRTLRIEMEKRRAVFSKPAEGSPEELKKLASLGYISTGATARSGPLPDPKDDILIVRELKRFRQLRPGRRYDEAIDGLRDLLDRNPRMWDVRNLYSQTLQGMGRDEEALDVLKRGLKESPEGATPFFVSIAHVCLKLGKLDEALMNAEIAKGRGDPRADELLSIIGRGQVRERQVYLIAARVEFQRNNLPKALELVDRSRFPAEGEDPRGLRGLHILRGEILRRMKRLIEAEAEFRQETRLFPNDLDAYGALADLYAAEGRRADARETLWRMIAANPTPKAYALGMKTLKVVGDLAEAEVVRRAAAAKFPSDKRFGGKI
jgi:choline-sulfatase